MQVSRGYGPPDGQGFNVDQRWYGGPYYGAPGEPAWQQEITVAEGRGNLILGDLPDACGGIVLNWLPRDPQGGSGPTSATTSALARLFAPPGQPKIGSKFWKPEHYKYVPSTWNDDFTTEANPLASMQSWGGQYRATNGYATLASRSAERALAVRETNSPEHEVTFGIAYDSAWNPPASPEPQEVDHALILGAVDLNNFIYVHFADYIFDASGPGQAVPAGAVGYFRDGEEIGLGTVPAARIGERVSARLTTRPADQVRVLQVVIADGTAREFEIDARAVDGLPVPAAGTFAGFWQVDRAYGIGFSNVSITGLTYEPYGPADKLLDPPRPLTRAAPPTITNFSASVPDSLRVQWKLPRQPNAGETGYERETILPQDGLVRRKALGIERTKQPGELVGIPPRLAGDYNLGSQVVQRLVVTEDITVKSLWASVASGSGRIGLLRERPPFETPERYDEETMHSIRVDTPNNYGYPQYVDFFYSDYSPVGPDTPLEWNWLVSAPVTAGGPTQVDDLGVLRGVAVPLDAPLDLKAGEEIFIAFKGDDDNSRIGIQRMAEYGFLGAEIDPEIRFVKQVGPEPMYSVLKKSATQDGYTERPYDDIRFATDDGAFYMHNSVRELRGGVYDDVAGFQMEFVALGDDVQYAYRLELRDHQLNLLEVVDLPFPPSQATTTGDITVGGVRLANHTFAGYGPGAYQVTVIALAPDDVDYAASTAWFTSPGVAVEADNTPRLRLTASKGQQPLIGRPAALQIEAPRPDHIYQAPRNLRAAVVPTESGGNVTITWDPPLGPVPGGEPVLGQGQLGTFGDYYNNGYNGRWGYSQVVVPQDMTLTEIQVSYQYVGIVRYGYSASPPTDRNTIDWLGYADFSASLGELVKPISQPVTLTAGQVVYQVAVAERDGGYFRTAYGVEGGRHYWGFYGDTIDGVEEGTVIAMSSPYEAITYPNAYSVGVFADQEPILARAVATNQPREITLTGLPDGNYPVQVETYESDLTLTPDTASTTFKVRVLRGQVAALSLDTPPGGLTPFPIPVDVYGVPAVFYAHAERGSIAPPQAAASTGQAISLTVSSLAGEAEAFQLEAREVNLTLTVLGTEIEVQPDTLLATVGNGEPNAITYFFIDGHLVDQVHLDGDGALTRALIAVDGLTVGEHDLSVSATTTPPDSGVPFTVLAEPVPPAEDVLTPEPPEPYVLPRRWTFQGYYRNDYGEFDRYLLPRNPETVQSKYAEVAIETEPTTAGGFVISWEGQAQPQEWTFGGRVLDQDEHDAMVFWARENRRVYITDHHGERVLVAMAGIDMQRVRDVNRPWHHTYSVRCTALKGRGL